MRSSNPVIHLNLPVGAEVSARTLRALEEMVAAALPRLMVAEEVARQMEAVAVVRPMAVAAAGRPIPEAVADLLREAAAEARMIPVQAMVSATTEGD
jgi:hypothetical protein